MAERGGPTTESGIRFQNQVAALYLGRLIDPRPRPVYDTVVEVRVEAPPPITVDDIVIRFADKHCEYIQVKESVTKGSDAWTKLWTDFAAQRTRAEFKDTDRIELLLGCHHIWARALRELCERARGADDENEWYQRLCLRHRTLLDSLKPTVVDLLSGRSLFSLFACCRLGIFDPERIKTDQVPYFIPQSNTARLHLFDTMLRMVSQHARIRQGFTKAGLLDVLAKEGITIVGTSIPPPIRNFTTALQVIDLTGYKASLTTLRVSTSFQTPLISLVLQNVAVSSAALDKAIDGPRLQAAKTALAQHANCCAEWLLALDHQLSCARTRETGIRERLRRLEQERPPEHPAPPFDTLEEQRHALERYDELQAEYGRSQAAIPHVGSQLRSVQSTVLQLETDLARSTNDCENEERRLEGEVGTARDQDILAWLSTRDGRGAQAVADSKTLAEGFLFLLVTDLSSSFLSKYVSPSTALLANQVGKDASRLAEETVRREYENLGKELLALCLPIEEGLAQGVNLTEQIRGVLDALPLDELCRSCYESQTLLASEVPVVDEYRSLIDPNSIASVSATFARRRTSVGQAISAVHAFVDKSEGLRASAQQAERQATLLLKGMREVTTKYQPQLSGCKVAWGIVSRVTQSRSLGADAKGFCACLQTEAKRRMGEPIAQLIERCESTDFGVRDAKAARAEHAAIAFLGWSEALKKRQVELEASAAELDRAIQDLAEQPWRQARAYRKRLRLSALLTVVPIFNVLCIWAAGTPVRRYDSAMRSNHPAYLGLGRWSFPWICCAIALSVAGVLGSAFVMPSLSGALGIAFALPSLTASHLSILPGSYAVSLVLWISISVRVLGIEKQRIQEGPKRPEDEEEPTPSPR